MSIRSKSNNDAFRSGYDQTFRDGEDAPEPVHLSWSCPVCGADTTTRGVVPEVRVDARCDECMRLDRKRTG